jgi:23S rRNA pseudouridine2605 synthase
MAKNAERESIRLNKFIADCGVASRRKADQIIEEGRITVNGKKVYELGQRVRPTDTVLLDGKPLKLETRYVYIMFNKPRDIVTSMSDPNDRPHVGQFFEDYPVRLFPVGRLDWDSEGLLLMTNDGEFAQKIAHPSKEIPKTYHVKLDDHVPPEKLEKLLKGVSILGGGKVKAKSIRKLRKGSNKKDWLEVVITEGKNRQIRKMFQKIGFDVQKLQRVAIGKLEIGKIERGQYKELTTRQIEKIFEVKETGSDKRKKTQAKTSLKRQKTNESSEITSKKKKKKKAAGRPKPKSKTYSSALGKKTKKKKKKKTGFVRK